MWISTAAAMLLLGGAPGSSPPAPQADELSASDIKAGFLELEDQYTDDYNAWRTKLTSVNSEFRRAYKADPTTPRPEYPEPVEPGYFPQFDRLAQLGSAEAQVWCLKNYLSEAPKEAQERDFTQRFLGVLQAGEEHHVSLPRIVMGHSSGKDALLRSSHAAALLSIVETATSNEEVKSSAAYMRASTPPVDGLSDELQESLKLSAMRSLVKRYPGTKNAKRAAGFVFRTENLQIGMVAPDIVGKDVDGNEMKLSDFRGKVTVIDFWGFW